MLGTWTSASLSVGKDINNPGPLLYDLLAVPVRINDPDCVSKTFPGYFEAFARLVT